MEVQSHGILFENAIIEAITGSTKAEYQKLLDNAYVASMDIKKGTLSDIDVSIKVSKDGKGIGCGDILRFIGHCSAEKFIMVVGVWNQISPTKKRYNEIHEFIVCPDDYNKLWGDITTDAIKPFVEYVKSIPAGKHAQMANRKLWKSKRQDIYDEYAKGIFTIDAKIDSKNQRRVQCSVKLSDLIESGIEHYKYDIEYKGIKLPYEQNSTPRQFS